MIALGSYLAQHDADAAPGELTPEIRANAAELVRRVDLLLAQFLADTGLVRVMRSGWRPMVFNANFTHTDAGGAKVRGGAPDSAHCTGEGVDLADNDGKLDAWLTDAKLEQFDLYREAPISTPSWTHLQTRAPHSGHRTFFP